MPLSRLPKKINPVLVETRTECHRCSRALYHIIIHIKFKHNSGLYISKSLWGRSSFQLAEHLGIWVFLSHCHLSQDIWSPYSFCQAHLACCTEYEKYLSKMGESILLWGKKTSLMSPVRSFVLLMVARIEVKILLFEDCKIFFFMETFCLWRI